ncbi:hypothetical protein BJ322DRAFT_1018485 [Thelephora terrestris]|uniref:Uncharacterized protein n=1 Tax=Thelephora terrestris TaxID=56493 RepID=A0A9P6HLZ8_9AGAM|nr:hypothetical protein BJ322DRAFT_1018485 [Thelephora terrestris]
MKRGRKRSEQSERRERTGVVKVVKGVGRSYKAKSGSDRENKNAGGTNKAAGRDVKRWLKWNRRESGNAARGSGRRRRATKEREARVPESGRRTDAGDPNNDEQGVESLSRGGSDRRARGIGEAGLGIPDGREVARLAGDWRESMERQVEEGGSQYIATQGRQVGKGPESLEGGWVMDLSRRARKTESGRREANTRLTRGVRIGLSRQPLYSSMDYAGDWTPSKGPNGIAPFAELDQLGEDCLFPPEKDEWSKPEIRQLIAGSPDCVNLVWQSVLAVWRLKTLEGRLEEEKELRGPWADHLSAWAFHIEPLRLVTDFAEAAHKVGHIEAEMVPDFGNSTGTAAGTTAGTTTGTTSHRAPTPAPSARISTEPAPMATEPAEDVEMVGEEIAPAPARVDKGKGRVRERFEVVVPPRAKPTPKTRAQAVEPSVGTKRVLSSSPSKEEGPSTSKKSRKSRRNQRVESDESEKEEPALLDLSGETVVEGDPLDVERIPLARGAVSPSVESPERGC